MVNIISTLIPEHTSLELMLSLLICVALGFFSYIKKILDLKGAVASFIVGLVIAVFCNIFWLLTLILFLMVTYGVTKLDFKYKLSQGVAQGKHGERGLMNVAANGAIPTLIALFRFQLGYPLAGLLFIISISVAASDSFANEIGVLSNKTYLITNLHRRVRPGTNGGVSVLGTTASGFGAFIPAVIGWFLISDFNTYIYPFTTQPQMSMNLFTLILPIIIGFIGCQIDSILGATMQRRKIINNDQVNFFSILFSILIATVIIILYTF